MEKIKRLVIKWHNTRDISLASDICELLYREIMGDGEANGED